MTPDAIDQDALRRAMAEARRDPKEAEHLDRLLKDRTWTDVATTAAYQCQTRNLKLKPWESPPMFGDVDSARGGERVRARELLDKLLACGLSRYEPDPIGALSATEARQES